MVDRRTVTADITVVGGGVAGVSAAIAAARLGATVSLVNNRPVLGGNSSSEVRVWVVGATAHGMQRYAREAGVIGELYLENQYRNAEGNPILWDEVVHDAVAREPRITTFLNTDVRSVELADDGLSIRSVRAWTLGSELDTTFESTYFLDCTGDGLVGMLAGADFMLGREGRDEYGESMAPETADSEFLGSTILFYTKDTNAPVRYVAPDSARDIRQTPIPEARVINAGDSGAKYWWIEWGGELDIVHDNEKIRSELRSVIFGVWDYIKNSGKFDAENLTLEWVGALPGKREYRRFLGDHVLTQDDILSQRSFDDAVAFGGWSIDLHPVEGMYAANPGAIQRYSNGVYDIPLRSLYSRNVPNLLMAGRDISATHVAFGSTRVMATCASGGEAAGSAAALCVREGLTPRELATRHPARVQQTLLRQDASVPGLRNVDPTDLVRRATISASGSLTSLDPAETAPAAFVDAERRQLTLDTELGILFPVDPRLDAVRLPVRAPHGGRLRARLYSTRLPQNHVPIDLEREVEIDLPAAPGEQQVELPFSWHPAEPANAVLVLHGDADMSVELVRIAVPGVMVMPHTPTGDGEPNVHHDEDDLLVQWPSRLHRGFAPRLSVEPATEAFRPDLVRGGFQRPYGGPQMWIARMEQGDTAHLDVAWPEPVEVARVQLVLDANVDVVLNTLHLHRMPEAVFPELIRDLDIEARVDGAWQTVHRVRDNRVRHVVVDLEHPVVTTALRIVALRTNGADSARVVSLRAYTAEDRDAVEALRPLGESGG